MKLTGQNVPPALLAEYKKLVATKPVNLAGVSQARTTKRAHAPAPTRPTRKEFRDYEKAVDFLIAYITQRDGNPPAAGFRAEQINNLKQGIFDTTYWAQCTVDTTDIFTSAPTSGAWVGARAYAYPDPANLPSIPTYGAGTASSGALDYIGATIAGTFKDLSLKWRRVVFSLANSFTSASDEPLFLKLTGSVAATANVRASRAMLSAIIKRWICLPGSTRLATTEAPTTTPIQAFWRYRTPRGASPYYAYTNPLQLVYTMRSSARYSVAMGGGNKYEETPGDLAKCVVLVAPMPMMGKRFNNNTSVAVTLTAALELWQIKKAAGYRGWLRNGFMLLPSGVLTAFSPSLSQPALFTDSTHGIKGSFYLGEQVWVLLNDSFVQTPFAAPWETGANLGRLYSTVAMEISTGGFSIFIMFNDDGITNRFVIDTAGALVSQTDEITTPSIMGIVYPWDDYCYWCAVNSRYVQTAVNRGVGAEVMLMDIDGVETSAFDYSTLYAVALPHVCASATGAAVIVRTLTFPTSDWAVYEQTDAGVTLIGGFTNALATDFRIAYHAGNYYCFGNVSTEEYYVMDGAGVVTRMARDTRVNMFIKYNFQDNWVGAA